MMPVMKHLCNFKETELPGFDERKENPLFESPKKESKRKSSGPDHLRVPLLYILFFTSSIELSRILTLFNFRLISKGNKVYAEPA